jgi:hypothetical protein
MAYREFADDDGLIWKVWDVVPAQRMLSGRGAGAISNSIYPSGNTPGHVAPGWETGWLAFQTGSSSRRLRPIPQGWETASEERLRFYLRKAVVAQQRHAPREDERAS